MWWSVSTCQHGVKDRQRVVVWWSVSTCQHGVKDRQRVVVWWSVSKGLRIDRGSWCGGL